MDETNWAATLYVSKKAKMVMESGRRKQQQMGKGRWRPASGAEDGRVKALQWERGDLESRHGRLILINSLDRSIDHFPPVRSSCRKGSSRAEQKDRNASPSAFG